MAAQLLARRFYVSGTVQGVGFRFFVERVAARMDICGYVRNLFDGRVEVYAIGSVTQLNTLKNEIERGPRMSRVDRVDENEAAISPQYANGFTIERDD
jgi:acylphosphatase